MAYRKQEERGESKALQKLREDMKSGAIGCSYVFYGEESYLREYYLEELRKALIPAGFEEFNYHRLEGKDMTAERLTEIAEAMPMMTERTLVTVTDWDLYKLNEEQREKLVAFFADIPPYCCVVFVYSAIVYKPNKTMKKLYNAMSGAVEAVEFRPAESGRLLSWIALRFKAQGKTIDRQTAEYLTFLCGSLMTGLVQEIGKIGAYAKGETVTKKDVDAVAEPVLSASAFMMADAVIKRDDNRAAELLGNLLEMQTEPILLLAALGSQLRRIYSARIAIDGGKDKYWLMKLWEMKSDYQAKLFLTAAKKTSTEWCSEALKLCQRLDRRMKSVRGCDAEGELKLLLAQLGAMTK